MIFNIDTEMVIDSILEAFESINVQASEEQLDKIFSDIDGALPGVIQIIAKGVSEYWKAEARDVKGWGIKYAEAVKYEVADTEAKIYLDKDLIDPESEKPYFMFAEIMEKGVKSWSIKMALLKSDKAKISSDGVRYIIVPFPVAIPRRKNQGKMQNKFGKREMTRAMYDVVKSGGRLKSGLLKVGAREIDISGLTKFNTRKFHGQYGIFRAVTEKSKGWQYPNKSPRPIYPSVLREVNKQIGELLKNFCQDIVKKYA